MELVELRGEIRKRGDPQVHFLGSKKAKLIFPIVSERFAAFADFTAKLDEFHGWLLDQPPFNESAVGNAIAIKGLFWPSNTTTGLFNTPDPTDPADRRFFGDRTAARALLKKHLKNASASLILIDSKARGGAGGTKDFSAWSSTTGGEGEFWGAVALHEIGHSLGLADEYIDENFSLPEPSPLEPNVSAQPRCGKTSWSALITVDPGLAPSHPSGHAPAGPDVIGTFEGARYKAKGRFRPTQTCLMRSTLAPFCPVCRAHIRTILA
jgi:IgA Peptidase M64